jgi:hypothetical protein
VEPHFHYWADLALHATNRVYIQGYWQCERYFSRHADTIRHDLTFKEPFNQAFVELAKTIRSCVAVSLHIRRGDYVGHSKHSACPIDYYLRAMASIKGRVRDAVFFAFSDDPRWTRAALASHEFKVIIVDKYSTDEAHNDMHLMSLCRHNVIANSSFSWWAAWLNPRPDKIVIAPKQWFSDGDSAPDLVPSNWERV